MPANKVRQRVRIALEDGGESSACGPIRDWALVYPWSRLVRRVPGAARVGKKQAANVAGDLFALQFGKAVEPRAVDDASIREVEEFQVASIARMTIRAMRP